MATTATPAKAIVRFNGENFDDWDTSVINSCATASSLHPKGLLGFILTEPNYILHATPVGAAQPALPFQPLPSAPVDMPAAGAQFAPWGYVRDQKALEEKDKTAWTILFVASLDESSTKLLSESRQLGLTRRTLSHMYQWMVDRHGTNTTDYLDKNRALPEVPFVDDGTQTVTAYMEKNHSTAHQVAQENGEPMAQTVKVSKLTKGLAPCGAFKTVLEHFVFSHPKPAAQTFEILSGLVRTFDIGRAARQNSGGSGLVNQATADQATIQAMCRQMEQMQAAIAVLTANAVRGPVNTDNSKRATAAPTAGLINTKANYCWSHGPQNSHGSGNCDFPREHHQKAATFENKMGGALVYTSTSSRGRK
jgi:hypothetical protein